MATGKELISDIVRAGEGIGNIASKGFNSVKEIFVGGGGAGKSFLGGVGSFALDVLSAPFKGIAYVGNNHPRLGLIIAAAATVVGYGWWKDKQKDNAITKQIETEKQIAAQLKQTGQMMDEAYSLVAQQQMQPHQWQNRIDSERALAEQQAAYAQRFPN